MKSRDGSPRPAHGAQISSRRREKATCSRRTDAPPVRCQRPHNGRIALCLFFPGRQGRQPFFTPKGLQQLAQGWYSNPGSRRRTNHLTLKGLQRQLARPLAGSNGTLSGEFRRMGGTPRCKYPQNITLLQGVGCNKIVTSVFRMSIAFSRLRRVDLT
jgi:hypothetical protein